MIILLSDYDPYSLLKFKCKTHDNEWQSTINNTIKSGCEICSGKKKWYKETVVEYLKSKNITLLSEYKNTTGKITVRCENDKHIWDTKFKHIQQSNKTGCPKCAGNIKYTQTEIDVILQKLNIIRNSEFVNVKTKMDFQCKKCDYLWTTNPTSVLNEKSGCAKCGKRPNYTNEDIDKLIETKLITRLDDYVNCKTKIRFKCNKGHVFSVNPLDFIKRKYTCPVCENVKRTSSHTNETFDEKIKHKGINKFIKRIGYYTTINHPIKFLDLNTQEFFITKPINVIANGARNWFDVIYRANNKVIDDCLINRDVIRISDFKRSSDKLKWRCSKNHVWYAHKIQVISSTKTGCPFCRNKGEEKLYNYIKETVKFDVLKRQKTFSITKTKIIRVDFYIENNDNKYIIERNGEQHYMPVCFGGSFKNAEKQFIKQKLRDSNLRTYCKEYGYKLIEIPYWMSELEISKELSIIEGIV